MKNSIKKATSIVVLNAKMQIAAAFLIVILFS